MANYNMDCFCFLKPSSAMTSSMMNSACERDNSCDHWYRLYKPNIIIMPDPAFSMICLIPSKRWADNDDVVKILAIFFFYKI